MFKVIDPERDFDGTPVDTECKNKDGLHVPDEILIDVAYAGEKLPTPLMAKVLAEMVAVYRLNVSEYQNGISD